MVRLRWTLDGTVSDSTADTTWHPTSGLSEGQHIIVVRAVDSTGLVSLPDTVRVKVYNKPPVLAHVRDTTLLTSQTFTVTLSAHDSDGAVKEYLFDTTRNGWDSSATAPTLRITSASESSRKIHWGARDDLGKTTTDSFAVTFMIDRPLLTAISDTVVSASKALVVSLNAHPLDGNSSAITKYLWSTNGSTWDSSSTASVSLSDTAGGALTVQWKVRNSLGNFSKPDTFVVTFLHAPVITSLSVDSNLTSWIGSTGTLNISWVGSIAGFPDEVIAWTLYGGINGSLTQLYSGAGTQNSIAGIDSGVSYSYRLVGKNQFGDSSETSKKLTAYIADSGAFVDGRDGQKYPWVRVGTQRWMAQNLNYNADSSVCYGRNSENCTTYGRLYSWTSAMNLPSSDNAVLVSASEKNKGICPSGWHIPNNAEWHDLLSYVDSLKAPQSLRSKSSWSASYSGTDLFGFSALPAGYRYSYSAARDSYSRAGTDAYFLSASQSDAYSVVVYHMYEAFEFVAEVYNKVLGFSLRCISD